MKSVEEDCENIKNDGLAFAGAGIPLKLYNCIYKTIAGMRKVNIIYSYR